MSNDAVMAQEIRDSTLGTEEIVLAVKAGGYRKPRILGSFDELDDLPAGSAVETSDVTDTVVLCGGDGLFRTGDGTEVTPRDLWDHGTKPFKVLHEPGVTNV